MSEQPSTIAIVFKGVDLAVHVGEHAWEKFPERPTRLRLDLSLTFSYADYFGSRGGYVDYDPLRAFVKNLEQRPHTNKLEQLAAVILEACFRLTPTARVQLSILKPEIFEEMDGVGLAYDVTREDFGR